MILYCLLRYIKSLNLKRCHYIIENKRLMHQNHMNSYKSVHKRRQTPNMANNSTFINVSSFSILIINHLQTYKMKCRDILYPSRLIITKKFWEDLKLQTPQCFASTSFWKQISSQQKLNIQYKDKSYISYLSQA